MLNGTDFLKIKELISESKEMDTESKSELLERLNKSKISGYDLNFVRNVEEIEKETYPFNKNKFIFVGENTEKEIFKGEEYTSNFLFEGDNLESLKVLRETHKNGIDVIYIDPPYNTGSKKFVYNDSFVSNDEGFRHSKWLSFMEKRLRLARELMTDDGVVFISIDDNEQAQLKLLCNQVFGEDNFVRTFIIDKTAQGANQSKTFKLQHEYLHMYVKNNREKIDYDVDIEIDTKKYKYKDEIGHYATTNKFDSVNSPLSINKNRGYTIYYKSTDDVVIEDEYDKEREIFGEFNETLIKGGYVPIRPSVRKGTQYPWNWSIKSFWEKYKTELVFKENQEGKMVIYIKNRFNGKVKDRTIKRFDTRVRGKGIVVDMGIGDFSYPKSIDMMKWVLSKHKNKNATVLDFFAGSGTTGHAVLELNNEDGGNRNFILCTNNENNICEEVTYQRLSKVINGYTTPKGKVVDGIPANLNYLKVEHIDTNEISDFSEVDVIPYIKLKEGVRYNCVDTFEYCESKNKYVFLVSTDSDMLSVEEFLERSDKKEVVIYCNNISVRNKYVNTPYYVLFKSINEKDILAISKS